MRYELIVPCAGSQQKGRDAKFQKKAQMNILQICARIERDSARENKIVDCLIDQG